VFAFAVLLRLAVVVTTALSGLVTRALAERREAAERGDVPGWVMITVMTAGLVAALWAVAGPQLEQMLRDALASVA
jgi:hypothetical protein